VAKNGFRRFLGPSAPTTPDELEDPPAAGGYGARPFAGVTTPADSDPVRTASVDEKVVEISVVNAKRAAEPRRRPASYAWVSQASRAGRVSWADMPTNF
jgi:hypothetical protein